MIFNLVRTLPASAVLFLGSFMGICLIPSQSFASTIVRFDTVLGDIDVRLFDAATPANVANFLNYVDDGDYVDSFIHRAPPNFVIQGGSFNFPAGGSVGNVPTNAPVANEPWLTNLRGTLAFAKQAGNPDSATSGWFFNLTDDNANVPGGPSLDTQNGGFTVFGRVIRNGLQTIDSIASQQLVNAGTPFTQLPVLDSFTPPNVFREDLVLINSISTLDIADGDYNFDGQIDEEDLEVWRLQNGSSLRIVDNSDQSLGTEMEADGNGDGVVDDIDLQIWKAAAGVPEPACLVLIAMSSYWLLPHFRPSQIPRKKKAGLE